MRCYFNVRSRLCPKCNTRGRPRRFLLTTPIHRETDIAATWKRTFPHQIFPLTLACERDTTRSANVAWTHANQSTDESTIINRRRGMRIAGWATTRLDLASSCTTNEAVTDGRLCPRCTTDYIKKFQANSLLLQPRPSHAWQAGWLAGCSTQCFTVTLHMSNVCRYDVIHKTGNA